MQIIRIWHLRKVVCTSLNTRKGRACRPIRVIMYLLIILVYTVPDEKVVDTYTEEWARDHNLYNENVLYGPYKYEYGTGITGLYEGLSMMKEGGIARLYLKVTWDMEVRGREISADSNR